MEEQDDQSIVEKVLNGNKQAYAHIVPRYQNKLYGLFRDRWVAVDESGTEYPMYGGGYSTDNKTGEIRPVENASFVY